MAQLDQNGLSAYTDKSSWGGQGRLYPVGCWTRYAYPGGTYILLHSPNDSLCFTAFAGSLSLSGNGYIRVK